MRPLDRIRIEGFKSIKQLDLKPGNLNLLIGANGAGKSNFISIFKLLNEMAEMRLQRFVGSKAPSMRLLAAFPGYQKVVHGVQIAQQVGLQNIQQKCIHFKTWFDQLSALPAL